MQPPDNGNPTTLDQINVLLVLPTCRMLLAAIPIISIGFESNIQMVHSPDLVIFWLPLSLETLAMTLDNTLFIFIQLSSFEV